MDEPASLLRRRAGKQQFSARRRLWTGQVMNTFHCYLDCHLDAPTRHLKLCSEGTALLAARIVSSGWSFAARANSAIVGCRIRCAAPRPRP
jgi:hypothetical protein